MRVVESGSVRLWYCAVKSEETSLEEVGLGLNILAR